MSSRPGAGVGVIRPRGNLTDLIEQAFARGEDEVRIARDLAVTLREVLLVKRHMDAVIADEKLRAELRRDTQPNSANNRSTGARMRAPRSGVGAPHPGLAQPQSHHRPEGVPTP